MKYPDFDKAFAPTPEIVGLSIEAAFRKGEKAMKLRHKITAMVSAAAVLAIICAAAVFALPGEPQPDVMAQPKLNSATVAPEETAKTNNAAGYGKESELLPDATLTPRPIPTTMPTTAPVYEDVVVVNLQEQAEEQIVYHTEKGKYYHYYMNCSGMMGARPHGISEAEEAGKQPCPVCVLGNGSSDWTSYPAPTPSTETTFVLTNEQPTPADRASDVFLNVFGAYIFDVFADYEYVSTNARGITGNGGFLTEEIEFCFAKDGWQFTPVRVTIESQDDKILSGNIYLAADEGFDFDWTGFCESCSPWFQKVSENVPATLDMFNAMDTSFEDDLEAITRVTVYFDSETKPSVCTMEFDTYFGFFTLSFDVNGDDVSLASMNYNVSRA